MDFNVFIFIQKNNVLVTKLNNDPLGNIVSRFGAIFTTMGGQLNTITI